MPATKPNLIGSIYKILCTTIRPNNDSKVPDNSYFKRRVQGFRAENEFDILIRSKNKRFLEGGQFISQKLTGQGDEENVFIYTTVSFDPAADYIQIYKNISSWDKVNHLFFIQILDTDWTTEDYETKDLDTQKRFANQISKPNFRFYRFDIERNDFEITEDQSFSLILNCFSQRAKARKDSLSCLREREKFNFLDDFEIPELKKLYATRYFMDVILRKIPKRQIIDLDGFILDENNITLVEIKEKEPIKSTPELNDRTKWSYGWDTRRILWYEYLLGKTHFDFYYIIKRIDNRTARNFEGWDAISIDDFLKGVSWSFSTGGGGQESTLTAPFLLFKDFETLI